MKIEKYQRKTFVVSAVEVTADNINQVAQWCGGQVRYDTMGGNQKNPYIHVKVVGPMNPRQEMAFVGDWVIESGRGYRVYTPKSFEKSFEAVFQKSPSADLPSGSA